MHTMQRARQVLVAGFVSSFALLGGCGGGKATTKPAASTPPASTPSAAWGLPPAEADLASRRVRGSTVAHVDDAVGTPKDGFKKVAGPFAGRAAERELSTATAFKVEKGACYRFYVDAEPAIRALAVVVRDAKGGTVVDDATDVVPARGAFCADESAELEVVLSVGLGQGRYALELWAKTR